MLKLLEKIFESGRKNNLNEDIIIVIENIYIVLDGATGLSKKNFTKTNSDAKWFVEQFKSIFISIYEPKKNIIEILRLTLKKLENEYKNIVKVLPLNKYEYPSAGMIMLEYLENGSVNFYRLGDCDAFVKTKDKEFKVFKNSTLNNLDNISISKLILYLKKDLSISASRDSIKDTLRQHREKMNVKNGYWVLSIVESNIDEIIDNIEYDNLQLNYNDKILLSSDGLTSFVDKYEYSSMFEYSLHEMIKKIRKIEYNDSKLLNYPRLKKSDDASGILLQYIK